MRLHISTCGRLPLLLPSPHRLRTTTRSFIDARVKWVGDPFLDKAVEKEKDLKPLLSLVGHILASPSKSLPISAACLLRLPSTTPNTTTPSHFFQKYPSFFSIFQPHPGLPLHVKLTPSAISLHRQESALHASPPLHHDAATRLAKLLMLTRACTVPFRIINMLRWDLGLPRNYVTELLSDYPDYFDVCPVRDGLSESLALKLVSWQDDLAVSALQERAKNEESSGKTGTRIRFSMNLPRGFDLEKRVKDWIDQWQQLPYISPYENAFHLAPSSDQAEKWMVAILHELLWLLVSKKTERNNLICLGEYWGFGTRFKKVLAHHPGIFYISNKISTQTVMLREAYKKDFLVERNPLIGMRHRYIYLMIKSNKFRRKRVLHSDSQVTRKHSSRFQKSRQQEKDGDICNVQERQPCDEFSEDELTEGSNNNEAVKVGV